MHFPLSLGTSVSRILITYCLSPSFDRKRGVAISTKTGYEPADKKPQKEFLKPWDLKSLLFKWAMGISN